MERFSRERKLSSMPKWLRERIEVNRIHLEWLVRQASEQIPAGARLLDAGSGEGQYRSYFTHTAYTGVDLAVGDVEWNYSGLDAVADLCLLPFPDNCFDAVLCTQTLEHVNDPMRVTQEIGRVLKPGGRYYLSVPMGWHQHQKPHDYYRYTSFGLEHLLEKSGMRPLEMIPMGGYFWFMSFNLQMFHDWFFPRVYSKRDWWLQLPFQLIVQSICFVLLPLLFYYLDRFDKVKDMTLGWVCIAEKVAEHATADGRSATLAIADDGQQAAVGARSISHATD